MKNQNFLFVSLGVLFLGIACSSPGTLMVQVTPEQQPVTYIRAYEEARPFVRRDMLPKGKGLFSSQFPESGNVIVEVKLKGKQPIRRMVEVISGQYQYLEVDIFVLPPSVDFIRMKANRELKFKPINKTENQKAIYLSYIDYIGRDLLLKKQIEAHLTELGYKIEKEPTDSTELIATINLVDFASKNHIEGLNEFTVNQYKFKVNVEQRLPGKTIEEEKRAMNRTKIDSINYRSKSYPMDDTTLQADLSESDVQKPIQVAPANAPESPGLLVMLGVVSDEGEEESEENAEQSEENTEQNKDAPTAGVASNESTEASSEGEESTEENEEGSGEEVPAPTSFVTENAYLTTKGTLSNTVYNYHLYKEETVVEASVRLTNLESKDDQAIDETISLLAKRLAHLFNL